MGVVEKKAPVSELARHARLFFERLQQDAEGKKLLREQSQRIEFDLTDEQPFCVEIHKGHVAVKTGQYEPRRFDDPDLIHFQLQRETLLRLLQGEIRFTDALIPVDPQARDSMLLLECTLFKWSVLNWVGRLFRAAQGRHNTA